MDEKLTRSHLFKTFLKNEINYTIKSLGENLPIFDEDFRQQEKMLEKWLDEWVEAFYPLGTLLTKMTFKEFRKTKKSYEKTTLDNVFRCFLKNEEVFLEIIRRERYLIFKKLPKPPVEVVPLEEVEEFLENLKNMDKIKESENEAKAIEREAQVKQMISTNFEGLL